MSSLFPDGSGSGEALSPRANTVAFMLDKLPEEHVAVVWGIIEALTPEQARA